MSTETFGRQRMAKSWGQLHFTSTELKLSYLMMGVTSGHSDGHVTLVNIGEGVATVT